MAKLRVHELARDLNLTNKVLLDRMKKLGVQVCSHMSALDDHDVLIIRESFFAKKRDNTIVRSTVLTRNNTDNDQEKVPLNSSEALQENINDKSANSLLNDINTEEPVEKKLRRKRRKKRKKEEPAQIIKPAIPIVSDKNINISSMNSSNQVSIDTEVSQNNISQEHLQKLQVEIARLRLIKNQFEKDIKQLKDERDMHQNEILQLIDQKEELRSECEQMKNKDSQDHRPLQSNDDVPDFLKGI
jgi:DNA repair ATPase RecN